jgi:hypothetical protein
VRLKPLKEMKKKLFLFIIILSKYLNTSGQVIYSENFETSRTSIPLGWHQELTSSVPTNKGWEFSNTFPTYLSYYFPANSYCAFVDAIDYDTGSHPVVNYDTLYSSTLICTGFDHVFISLDILHYYSFDSASLAISTDGGNTWLTAINFPIKYYYSYSNWAWSDSSTYDISEFVKNKPNVKLAFTYKDPGDGSFGIAIDDIKVFKPISYDVSITSQNLTYLMQVGTPYYFLNTIINHGGDSITSMNLNYSINGGPPITDTITRINNCNSFTSQILANNIPYTPSAVGTVQVKFWADHLNSLFADQNHSNDTLIANFLIVDSIKPREALIEEFTSPGCPACNEEDPIFDTTAGINSGICNTISYYSSYTDYIAEVTDIPFAFARSNYYDLNAVPTFELDGSEKYDTLPSSLVDLPRSNDIIKDVATGSPFTISITHSSNNINTYSVIATIKSYGVFPPGLKAHIVLVVDTITYHSSTPIQPMVVEDMMPDTIGISLGAFVAEQTQTINASWVKNHPWSYNPKVYTYDSTTTRFVVFIQDDQGNPLIGIPPKYIYQSFNSQQKSNIITGENTTSQKLVGTRLYPNPNNGYFTITWEYNELRTASLEIYNLKGERIYSIDLQSNNSHINIKNFAQGMYLYRVISQGIFVGEGKFIVQ